MSFPGQDVYHSSRVRAVTIHHLDLLCCFPYSGMQAMPEFKESAGWLPTSPEKYSMIKDSGATLESLEGRGARPKNSTPHQIVIPAQRQLFTFDTGGLRVRGIVKIHMRKLQKKLNILLKETNSRKVRVGHCCFTT